MRASLASRRERVIYLAGHCCLCVALFSKAAPIIIYTTPPPATHLGASELMPDACTHPIHAHNAGPAAACS